MKKLFTATIAGLCVFILCPHSYADVVSQKEAVEELFLLMNTSKMIESAKMQTRQMILQQYHQQEISDAKKPIFDKTMSKIDDLMNETINWDKIKEDMIALYMNTFTEDEIIDMVIFYKSPTGKSLVEKMPIVMKASMEISQKQSFEMIPRLNMLLEEMKKELEQE